VRVLILGTDTPVGYSLRAFASPLQRHELAGVELEATRWKRERQAKKLLRSESWDLLVDTRLVTAINSAQAVGQPDVERTLWLAQLCQKMAIPYLHLSSSRVFSGAMTRPYRETDTPDAVDDMGKVLIDVEKALASEIDNPFILRLGRVFAGRRPNSLSAILDRLLRGERVVSSDRYRGSPVHVAEVARVVSGMMDQVSVGAPSRGLYHYCSLGDTGYYTFVEAVVAIASQFETFANARELLIDDTDATQPVINRSLDCTAIRHQFGIQQLSWRGFTERAVRRYIELYVEKSKS
jgi:dTDP-4-dehydrorhamnose reductase